MTENRFMKYPKTTTALFAAVILIVLVLGFEKYLAWTKPASEVKLRSIKRHVRLRERDPLTVSMMKPVDPPGRHITDSLVYKDYRLQIDKDGFIFPSRVH